MKTISIITLLILAIGCSSKVKKNQSDQKLNFDSKQEQAISIIGELDDGFQEVNENKIVQTKPVVKLKNKNLNEKSFQVFDKETKTMIDIKNCSHIVYNKQFSQPTCLKSL